MAKTRLNKAHRAALTVFAKENLQVPEKKEYHKLRDKLIPMIEKVVRTEYPEKDMNVLRTYELTKCIKSIKGTNLDTGQIIAVNFDKDFRDGKDIETIEFEVPVIVKYTYEPKIYTFNASIIKAIEAYILAHENFQKAWDKKLADYRSVIEGTKYFDDLVEIWPAANVMRTRITGQSTAITVLSEDMISRIREDNAGSHLMEEDNDV